MGAGGGDPTATGLMIGLALEQAAIRTRYKQLLAGNSEEHRTHHAQRTRKGQAVAND